MKYSAGLIPIDYRILKEMTAEGTELAEFIPLGPSVKALAKRIDGITSNQIGGRVRVLEGLGYCVPIPLLPASQGRGWQRTSKGDVFLQAVQDLGIMQALDSANSAVNEPAPRERDTTLTRSGVPHAEDSDDKTATDEERDRGTYLLDEEGS